MARNHGRDEVLIKRLQNDSDFKQALKDAETRRIERQHGNNDQK